MFYSYTMAYYLQIRRNAVVTNYTTWKNLETIIISAVAGVAQWIECWPVNQRVAGSISSQSTCLGCRPGPQ